MGGRNEEERNEEERNDEERNEEERNDEERNEEERNDEERNDEERNEEERNDEERNEEERNDEERNEEERNDEGLDTQAGSTLGRMLIQVARTLTCSPCAHSHISPSLSFPFPDFPPTPRLLPPSHPLSLPFSPPSPSTRLPLPPPGFPHSPPPGEYLLQTQAGSTLGRMLIQVARARGIRTINVVRRAAQAAELKALGGDEVRRGGGGGACGGGGKGDRAGQAEGETWWRREGGRYERIMSVGEGEGRIMRYTAVICSTDESVPERVRTITGGHMAHAAVESVAGDLTGAVLSSVRPGGTVLLFGGASGATFSASIGDFIFRDVTLKGFWLGPFLKALSHEQRQAVVKEAFDLIANNTVTPFTGDRMDLPEFATALKNQMAENRQGKILLSG
ncbi:unnamed protein product [Closterium sp. NIES-65]|nr:unnamed protein product [Closterium sp. NIES-65]